MEHCIARDLVQKYKFLVNRLNVKGILSKV